ncbi:MAG: TetR/AcrR family transcriptional regulator [Ardenticatenaceae bacterium]|nr:TetR/AcrR family transcriptional regulator [Ardenticatenaceae bacterium]
MESKPEPIPLGNLAETGADEKVERRDAAANRTLILQTAVALFDEHGVSDVNMADIAQAAGVGKGTLYRRFNNKGDLCLALLDTQMSEFQETMLAQMRQMTADGETYMAQLGMFLDALVHFTAVHQPLLCEIQREGLFLLSATLSLPHFWQYMTVSGLLQAATTAGEISPELDIAYIADALLAPLKTDIFRFQREVREFSLERISAGLRSLTAALAAAPS